MVHCAKQEQKMQEVRKEVFTSGLRHREKAVQGAGAGEGAEHVAIAGICMLKGIWDYHRSCQMSVGGGNVIKL